MDIFPRPYGQVTCAPYCSYHMSPAVVASSQGFVGSPKQIKISLLISLQSCMVGAQRLIWSSWIAGCNLCARCPPKPRCDSGFAWQAAKTGRKPPKPRVRVGIPWAGLCKNTWHLNAGDKSNLIGIATKLCPCEPAFSLLDPHANALICCLKNSYW